MENNIKILSHILDYLALTVKDFKTVKRGNIHMCTCPFNFHDNISCVIIPNVYKLRCNACNKDYGNLIDIVRLLEKDKELFTDDEILIYISNLLKLDIKPDNNINNVLDFYEKNGFDLVLITKNKKVPVELSWTTNIHKNKDEWHKWLENEKNIGVKTGRASGITIIDIDQEIIPTEIDNLLPITLYQKSSKGHHLFFKYVADLPTTRIDELKTDILNDGKQCVIYPSVVEGVARDISLGEIVEMPEALINYFKSKISVPVKSFSERLKEDIVTENLGSLNLTPIEEGNRTNFLLRFGGILRKELNINQTSLVLSLTNKMFCKPQLPTRELDNILTSLDKYTSFDENELALKILQYMKVVEEANSTDIREALGERTSEGKQRIEKAIKFLTKEGFLIKKRRIYHLIKRAEWKEEWNKENKEIDFNLPYFHDISIFRSGDMIVVGARSGAGKTHCAMNMIKRLVEQGKKPHYISLESGSRFSQIASQLNLREGDFKYCIHFNPQNIELEENTITIIDWLLPDDYANTDKLYKYFSEQLVKKGGILIVFVQLKQNNEFFAQNMIDLFPAFVTKFLYEDETGVRSYFQVTKMREPKGKTKYGKISCVYNFETKELQREDEIKNVSEIKQRTVVTVTPMEGPEV